MRPVGNVSYCDIRMWTDNKYYAAMDFPNPPYEGSFLYNLRARTGIDFDLPGEAQWEFACRAGHGEGEWGNGAKYDYQGVVASAPISLGIGRTAANVASSGSGPEAGPAICGSYPPNDWGLYDMHGNISEWCLDWFVAGVNLDYQVNIDPTNPANRLSNNDAGTKKVRRGGSYNHPIDAARSAARNQDGPATRWDPIGFRVICPVEAK
jgi:formylglycine-generating enzyme required for sulfatase activity